MAPLKPLRSLYDLSLDGILKLICIQILRERKNNLKKLGSVRQLLSDYLHPDIREILIQRALTTFSCEIDFLIDVVELLGDFTTKKLNFRRHRNESMSSSHARQLFEVMKRGNILNLQEFVLRVKLDQGSRSVSQLQATKLLQSLLMKGLATNLRVLTLYCAADNLSLKIIGQHAKHLTHLDVTSSWVVTDAGIGELLFQDASEVIKSHLGEMEMCEPVTIEALATIPKSDLHHTCMTLEEVKIQHTNTTSISVLLLLLLCKNLKSLGGFLYSRGVRRRLGGPIEELEQNSTDQDPRGRNIGDAVLRLQTRGGAPSPLPLSQLWDTQLPPDKLLTISQALPNLDTLYTRASWLPHSPDILPRVNNLSADFDFAQYEHVLFDYLAHSGYKLRRLAIVDQIYAMDVSRIAELCPNLEELIAKIVIDDYSPKSTFYKLRHARVRLSCSSTFIWLIKNSPNIEKIEVLVEYEEDGFLFDDEVILQLIDDNPNSLQTLKHISINFFISGGRQNITLSSIYALAEACDQLKMIGDLDTWPRISTQDLVKLYQHIKTRNWDFKVRHKDDLYPKVSSK